MKKTIIKVAAVCLVAGAVLTSCTKEGPVGPAGTNGTNGNANVHTYNETISASNWAADSYGGWYAGFTTTGFDPTKGAVSMFWSSDNTNWIALPYVGYIVGAPDINYSFNSTSVTIAYDAQTGVSSIAQPANSNFVKVVVIPPAMVKPNVNVHSYAELKAAYNIN